MSKSGEDSALLAALQFDEHGLIPAIVQDQRSNKVLTLCHLNQEAIQKTLQSGFVHVFRAQQGRVMMKGEQSGHRQRVDRILIDCEGKSLLLRVTQQVAACHRGYFSCYHRAYDRVHRDLRFVEDPVFDPYLVYRAGPEEGN